MSGHITDPKLYELIRKAAADLLRDLGGPTLPMMPGAGLQRFIDKQEFLFSGGKFDPSKVPDNLKPRDAGTDRNRFTGAGPFGVAQKMGGLYTSTGVGGLAAESGHYATKESRQGGATVAHVGFIHALSRKAVIELTPRTMLTLLDLRGSAAAMFLDRVVSRPAVRDAWAAAASLKGWQSGYAALLDASSDFTVSRAIGHAAVDRGFHGIFVPSARASDRDGEAGENVVLLGPVGEPIPFVRATRAFVFNHHRGTSEPEWAAYVL